MTFLFLVAKDEKALLKDTEVKDVKFIRYRKFSFKKAGTRIDENFGDPKMLCAQGMVHAESWQQAVSVDDYCHQEV